LKGQRLSVSRSTLRVLIIHNRYRQPGGEDVVAAAQARLLREHGHDVHVFEKDNREIDGYGLFRKIGLFLKTADNPLAAADVSKVVREFKPQVAHVHNTLPLLSPSIYAPLKKAGVKVIQYLHNYRLLCAAGTLFRDGKPCTLCVDDGIHHAVKHRCWTGSKLATLAYTRMIERHRRADTWRTQVDQFVALNHHMRDLLVKQNIVNAAQIVVQPNFLYVDGAASTTPGDKFVFAARLVPEKGLQTLLRARDLVGDLNLEIIGDGPMLPADKKPPYLGHLPHDQTLQHLSQARALVFPSEWQEGCPSTIIEAMALGRAVIASRVAGAVELVQDGVTGLFFEPGDAEALAACIKRLRDDPTLAQKLGAAGRQRYENEFSPAAGYRRLNENFAALRIS
jgi:glycosyltransferase involved in cell wall biosynthesis